METDRRAESVRHYIIQPMGYFKSPMGDAVPWFDNEGRSIALLLHDDGTVTWEMRGPTGKVLEP